MNTTQTLTGHKTRAGITLNLVLWIVQIFLAIVFMMAGALKAFQPYEAIARFINWAPDVSPALVRFIGVSEILGAIGLILPGWIGFWPRLTVPAASGLSFIMFSASIFHLIRGEYFALPLTVFLCALAAFVEHGRLKLAPF